MIVCDFLDFKTCCTSKNGSKCNFIAREKKEELPTTCYWIQLELGLLVLGGEEEPGEPRETPLEQQANYPHILPNSQETKAFISSTAGFQVCFKAGVNKEFQWINSHCSHQIIINFLLICRVMSGP